MEGFCEICCRPSDAEVCDACVKKFCKKSEDKGYCFYCLDYSCIEESNKTLCPICKREVPKDKWEKHHLIPRSENGKITIMLCVSCGDAIHKIFTLNELRDKYNTLDSIISHPLIVKWVKWVSKKPNDFSICMKEKKKR